jgi:hypothetical protein
MTGGMDLMRKQCHWCCHWTALPLKYVCIAHLEPSLDGRTVTKAWFCWRCLLRYILKPIPQVEVEPTDQQQPELEPVNRRRSRRRRVASRTASRRWHVQYQKLDSTWDWRLVQVLTRAN